MREAIWTLLSRFVDKKELRESIEGWADVTAILARPCFWKRFGNMYDLLDCELNGSVMHNGRLIADPHDKKVGPLPILLALVLVVTTEPVFSKLRAGTQYDPDRLPLAP